MENYYCCQFVPKNLLDRGAIPEALVFRCCVEEIGLGGSVPIPIHQAVKSFIYPEFASKPALAPA